MFTFQKFQQCAAATEITDKQAVTITAKLAILLNKYNNNPDINLEYFLKNLKINKDSAKFSSNNNPSRPFVFIDINFRLESTLIEARVTAEFNSSCCRIPYTYSHFDVKIEHTDRSELYSVLNIYRPKVGLTYFHLGQWDDPLIYTVSVRDAFKFSHHFSPTRNRFHIEYKLKKGKLISSFIINDEHDDYAKYKNKMVSAEVETLYINFANLAYTRDSEWINSILKNDINFKNMNCFEKLKDVFLSLYEGEHQEMLLNELKVFEMYHI